ncbi:SDR family oxidoreductase [Phenylobacterium sp.]|uniref:SDR family NAD(P)-dependent oxidoreductase n=1 Tax=Phenylobacterium sp. TaxID=1871053 RepID=UPI002F416717
MRALVTGAGAGIGKASATALAERGVEVILCDIDAPAAEAVAADLAAQGHDVWPASLDVTDDAAVQKLVAGSGRVDALVHSAGLFPQLSFEAGSIAQLDRVMAVNFRAAVVLAKAVWPGMAARGAGTMIFLTSGSGLPSAVEDPMQANFSFYGASKAALDRWALGVAREMSRHGVLVNTITPGAFVDTPGVQALGLAEAAQREAISVEAVGEAVAFLAAGCAPELSGQRLRATDYRRTWGA